MYLLAKEKLEEILAADPLDPVDSQTEIVIYEIIEEAKAKL